MLNFQGVAGFTEELFLGGGVWKSRNDNNFSTEQHRMSDASLLLNIEWTRELVQLVSNFLNLFKFVSNQPWHVRIASVQNTATYTRCICKETQTIFEPWGLSIQECGKSLWHIQTSVAYKMQVYSLPGCCTQFRRDISSLVVKQHLHTCDIETKRGQLLSLRVLQDLLKSTILEGFKGRNYVEGNKHVFFHMWLYHDMNYNETIWYPHVHTQIKIKYTCITIVKIHI